MYIKINPLIFACVEYNFVAAGKAARAGVTYEWYLIWV